MLYNTYCDIGCKKKTIWTKLFKSRSRNNCSPCNSSSGSFCKHNCYRRNLNKISKSNYPQPVSASDMASDEPMQDEIYVCNGKNISYTAIASGGIHQICYQQLISEYRGKRQPSHSSVTTVSLMIPVLPQLYSLCCTPVILCD